MKSAKGKRIALFLDYDGTLSPIVDNPDCAFMSDAVRTVFRRTICELPLNFSCYFIFFFQYISVDSGNFQMRAVVKKVAKYFPTAIISGRSRDKVIDRPLVTLKNVNVILFVNSWNFLIFFKYQMSLISLY